MPRLRLALAGLAVLAAAAPAAAGEPRHWPLWPSEVARVAEPLRPLPGGELRVIPETRKIAAVRALDRYPTPLVAPLLVEALDDRASGVRREALAACLERQIVACAAPARRIWTVEIMDPALRISALRVVALGGEPDRLPLFLAALRDPDEQIRAEAVRTFVAATWPKDQHASVRAGVIAKLADPSPVVRRAAAYGLGMLGPGDGALALTRLLADPDPQVRQDTADALGRLRDPRAAPALLRALQAGDETYVARSFLVAFAAVPGPDVDLELLRLFDAPPRNLSHRTLAEVIARRPAPGPALAEGLVARLREDPLRGPALDALLGLGEVARPALRAAQTRGLEPPLDLEVRRLLAALDLPDRPTLRVPPWPKEQDREAWSAALADPDPARRLLAARALGERAPAWLAAAAAGRLEAPAPAELRRPWLLALAVAEAWTAPAPAALARLSLWTGDHDLASADRCLALAALAGHRPDRSAFEAAAARRFADRDPGVRACAAGLAAWLPERAADPALAGLLHDPAARVRTAAALALACRDDLPAELALELAVLAARDPDPAVQRAAGLAQTARAGCPRWAPVLAPDGTSGPYVAVRWRDRPLLLPAETLGPLRLAWGPGLADAEPLPGPGALEVTTTPIRMIFE